MDNKIILYPSNWLYNAGVVGLLRILEFAGKTNVFQFNDDGSIVINDIAYMSENFEIYYFEYVSKLYLLQRFNLKDLKDFIRSKINAVNDEKLKEIDINISNIQNDIENKIINVSANKNWDYFISSLKLIENNLNKAISQIQNDIVNISQDVKDREKSVEICNNVVRNFRNICDDIKNFKSQKGFLGRFYFNKSAVANPNEKGSEIISKFKKQYVEPINSIKNGDNLCVLCGKKYSEQNMSELTEGDFSVLGISKESFANFYNFYIKDGLSYNRKCCVCQLLLLCTFAGFNLKPYYLRELDETDYIFVNYPSFEEAFSVNNKLEGELKNYQFGIFTDKINTYLKSFEIILQIVKKKTRWLLENIYFAEIKTLPNKQRQKPKFVYFNIDRALAEVIEEFDISNLLQGLSFSYEITKKNRINLSTEVLKRLIEKQSLVCIACKISSEKLSEHNNNFSSIWNLILLEFVINQKRRLNMSAKTSYGILKNIQEQGKAIFSLDEIDREKRFHIAQRFLTLIRGARREDFYSELLRLLVVYEKPIPEVLFSILSETEKVTFQEKALAFLTGFINPQKEELIENNKKEENNG